MRLSATGLALIKESEGLRTTAYKDTGGVWTLGFGCTTGVTPAMTCTEAQAEAWLKRDVLVAEAAVSRLVKVPLTQSQFDALVDFTYNLGPGKLETSTLLKLLNAGKPGEVPAQLKRWIYDNGRVQAGLVKRRAAEAALWVSDGNPDPLPRVGPLKRLACLFKRKDTA